MKWTKLFHSADETSDADRERDEVKTELRGAVAEIQSVVSRLDHLIQPEDDDDPLRGDQ